MTAIYDNRKVLDKRAKVSKTAQQALSDSFLAGFEAAARLLQHEYAEMQLKVTLEAHATHSVIENAEARRKSREFYQRLLLWRAKLVSVLSEAYRRFLKLALAQPERIGGDTAVWAWERLQPAIRASVDEIREWTLLACEGANRAVRPIGTMESVGEGQTTKLRIALPLPPAQRWKAWRAPAWLFLHYAAVSGIGPLKTHHAAAQAGDDGRLGAAQTRLILGGLRRIFLAELYDAVVRIRDEELALAAATPTPLIALPPRRPNRRKGWEHKERLLALIREILANDPSLKGMAFCAELDKRHAPPLPAWERSGEWNGLTFKAAWRKPRLRKKIRRVRQEAMLTRP